MNERIRLLAMQANVLHTDFFDNEWEVEKFAQLIVKECMSFQDEAGVYSKFDMADAIAKHFGVEE